MSGTMCGRETWKLMSMQPKVIELNSLTRWLKNMKRALAVAAVVSSGGGADRLRFQLRCVDTSVNLPATCRLSLRSLAKKFVQRSAPALRTPPSPGEDRRFFELAKWIRTCRRSQLQHAKQGNKGKKMLDEEKFHFRNISTAETGASPPEML